MAGDFEVVPSTRGGGGSFMESAAGTKLAEAAADNLPQIIGLAKELIDLGKIKAQSEAVLKKMAEDRRMLRAETDAYVERKSADSHQTLGVLDKAQIMLREFYQFNKADCGLTGDQFSKIISEVLSKA